MTQFWNSINKDTDTFPEIELFQSCRQTIIDKQIPHSPNFIIVPDYEWNSQNVESVISN